MAAAPAVAPSSALRTGAAADAQFEAKAWLSQLVAIGGGYALASGRKLWLVVEHCDADDLASVMRPLVGEPDRVEAVRTAIERRSFGEA